LVTRFAKFIRSDSVVVSTFLDPRFGVAAMDYTMKTRAMSRMTAILKKQTDILSHKDNSQLEINTTANSQPNNRKERVVAEMKQNFIFTEETEPVIDSSCCKIMLEDFVKKSTKLRPNVSCPLNFWKSNELNFPELAILARQYLSIQASSAACERIFSLSGHIFSIKRRRLGYQTFSDLVFLKLNENLLMD
jgi:hypothetical protein